MLSLSSGPLAISSITSISSLFVCLSPFFSFFPFSFSPILASCDAVGWSGVPEASAAGVLGVSTITSVSNVCFSLSLAFFFFLFLKGVYC